MEERWSDSVRKAVLLSGGTGLLFGVAFSVFMLFNPSPDRPKGPILLVVPVLTTLVSGAAGAAGTYLDRYLTNRGVAKPSSIRVPPSPHRSESQSKGCTTPAQLTDRIHTAEPMHRPSP